MRQHKSIYPTKKALLTSSNLNSFMHTKYPSSPTNYSYNDNLRKRRNRSNNFENLKRPTFSLPYNHGTRKPTRNIFKNNYYEAIGASFNNSSNRGASGDGRKSLGQRLSNVFFVSFVHLMRFSKYNFMVMIVEKFL